jgi:hypothetical protein
LYQRRQINGGTQTAARLIQERIRFIQRNPSILTQIQRMENAVKRFEAPRMQPGLFPRHLQGTFVIIPQKDTGCAPIMAGIRQHPGVNYPPAGGKGVILYPAVHPTLRIIQINRHMRYD